VQEVNVAFPQMLARAGMRSAVFAPLLTESKISGVLIVARREPRSFTSASCEFLRQLSEHTALAAHQMQLYIALQQAYDDLRQTQHTVMQQERLRALGQMASGIAHDINNAISPVALYTESLLEREPNLSERARDYLTTIQRAIEDVADTVSRMREFYRPREPQLQLASVDMNKLVKQVLDLTRVRWSDEPQQRGAMVELRMEIAPDLPPIMGAEGEIRDALTNLIFNATDAMPDGGTLTVRTCVRSVTSPEHGDTLDYVLTEVRDTGIGMSEDTRRRCLEPFFTTKGERGTGLGLPMVYGMVQRHSADLEIDSEPGKGTTMRLVFPIFTPQGDATAVHTSAPQTPAERMRILIVDDDPLLTKSLRDTLEADGHQVTAADGGQAGIETFIIAQSREEDFQVVITDLGMPYVDGRKVAAAIYAASPETPIIMLTGWGQRMVADGDIPPHVDRVLNKPPRLHDLRGALAEAAKKNAAHRQ
jgi:signal transduction histidine kinase/ActR/RegA family two-component response regulator